MTERKPKTHDLKCWPQAFEDLATGEKRCEVRVNDRDYGVGDRLVLREWDPATKDYTGPALQRIVTHVLLGGGGPYSLPRGLVVLPDGLCVLSVVPLPEPDATDEMVAGRGTT